MSDPEQTLREGVRIVLVRPIHPGNVGATARAMKNMGLRRLVVVDPPCFDLERARWMAGGGRDVLEAAQFVPDVASAVGDCDLAVGCTARMRRWDWPVWEPAALGAEAMRREGNTAILFGREDMGLENEDLAYCQALLRIPTDGEPSLNLSQAVLLVCGALFQSARDAGWTPTEEDRQTTRSAGRGRSRMPRADTPLPAHSAPLAMQHTLVERAVSVLSKTSYMNGKNEGQVRVALGQMLQKLHPTEKEATILLGMARKTRIRLSHLDGGEE